jgi:hypothetical protein
MDSRPGKYCQPAEIYTFFWLQWLRNLGWCCNRLGRWGGAGSSYELDAAPEYTKYVSIPYFGYSGRLLFEGIIAHHIQFYNIFIFEVKKDTYDDISARRVLKTKQLVDDRLGLHIFFKI